jgi:hypothetical protein
VKAATAVLGLLKTPRRLKLGPKETTFWRMRDLSELLETYDGSNYLYSWN